MKWVGDGTELTSLAMTDRENGPNPAGGSDEGGARLERELGGELPCVSCGYSLRGMSIRGVCPECGTQVRATILAKVDPLASELRPIRFPRLMAASLAIWAGAALLAALVLWLPLLVGMIGASASGPGARPSIEWWVVGLVVLSGVGAIGLIRPYAGVPWWKSMLVAFGVIGYGALALVLWRIEAGYDAARGEPRYFSRGSAWVLMDRTRLHAVAYVLVMLIALSIRPMARVLVARCLVLRTGRVDRQRILAIAAAAGIAALGDSLGMASEMIGGNAGPTLSMLGVILLALGAALVTVGLFGALADTLRIGRAIVTPRMGLREALGGEEPDATR